MRPEDSAHAGAIGLAFEPLTRYISQETDTVQLVRNAGVIDCIKSESLHSGLIEWSLASAWGPDGSPMYMLSSVVYRGTSHIRKRPSPWDPPRTLGIGLR